MKDFGMKNMNFEITKAIIAITSVSFVAFYLITDALPFLCV